MNLKWSPRGKISLKKALFWIENVQKPAINTPEQLRKAYERRQNTRWKTPKTSEKALKNI